MLAFLENLAKGVYILMAVRQSGSEAVLKSILNSSYKIYACV